MKAKPQGRRVASTPGTQSTLRGGKKSVWGDEVGLVTRHGAGEEHGAFRKHRGLPRKHKLVHEH